jgi:proline-specific peptidase
MKEKLTTHKQIRDVSLFVKVMGQRYPLVLMHGGPSLDHTTLLPLEPLADQFTLIFYDHRCNGRSEGADVSTMTMDNLTADADALRQALGYDQWIVLGHSFGGNVALEYALRYPQSLSHLILMNTGGDQWWVNQNGPQILAKRGFSPNAVKAARRFFNGQLTIDDYLPTFMKFMKAYSYHSNPLEQPGIVKLALKLGLGPPMKLRPEALIFGYQMLKGWTVMDRLSEIQAPTLVLAGRHDFLFPPEHQAILADRLPNARLEIIECAGHNPQMERNADVIQAIKDFLGDVSHSTVSQNQLNPATAR